MSMTTTPEITESLVVLPINAAERKNLPLFTGCLKYFPSALIAVCDVSRVGNDQHNPGQPLHWARGKGGNNFDELVRHLMEAGKFDSDGRRHLAKSAWRVLAALQLEIEEDAAKGIPLVLEGTDGS
jgi:hypothetical protein